MTANAIILTSTPEDEAESAAASLIEQFRKENPGLEE